jgi:hypothetical protein
MAIVPDREFRAPTLMVGPDVSTHDAAFAESDSVALLPQPDNNRLAAATTLPAARADLFTEERRGTRMHSLSSCQQRSSADERLLQRRSEDTAGCRIGTLDRLCFCEMSVCDEQINLSLGRNWFAVCRDRSSCRDDVVTIRYRAAM